MGRDGGSGREDGKEGMAEATSATPANKEAVVAGVRAGVMLVGDGVEEGSRFAHPIPDPAHCNRNPLDSRTTTYHSSLS